jgi:hypothetical protein
MTEVGNRALELTGRTRFLDLQGLLGVEEVDEKRQESEEEQENQDEPLVGSHVLLYANLTTGRVLGSTFQFTLLTFRCQHPSWNDSFDSSF